MRFLAGRCCSNVQESAYRGCTGRVKLFLFLALGKTEISGLDSTVAGGASEAEVFESITHFFIVLLSQQTDVLLKPD